MITCTKCGTVIDFHADCDMADEEGNAPLAVTVDLMGRHLFHAADPDAPCPTCGFAAWMHDPAQVSMRGRIVVDTTPLHLVCAICGRTRDFSDHDHPSMGHGFIPAGRVPRERT